MNERDINRYSDSSKEEELPMVTLKKEDKIRIVKGMILLLLFSSIVIFSIIYCNAPNYSANIIFSNDEIFELKNETYTYPIYQLDSRLTYNNIININISLVEEDSDIFYENKNKFYLRLYLLFTFNKNKVKILISDIDNKDKNEYLIPVNNLCNGNDLNCINDENVESVDDSNFAVYLKIFPFGFRIYGKETNNTYFDTINEELNKLTIFPIKNID